MTPEIRMDQVEVKCQPGALSVHVWLQQEMERWLRNRENREVTVEVTGWKEDAHGVGRDG